MNGFNNITPSESLPASTFSKSTIASGVTVASGLDGGYLGYQTVVTPTTVSAGAVKTITVTRGLVKSLTGDLIYSQDVGIRGLSWTNLPAIASPTLLGRSTAGSGDVEAITPDSTTLLLSGGTLTTIGWTGSIP